MLDLKRKDSANRMQKQIYLHFAEVQPLFAEQRYEKGLFLPKKVDYTLDTFVYYHMIFVSPVSSPVADSELVKCTPKVGYFADRQSVLGLFLKEGEDFHRSHPCAFLFFLRRAEMAEEKLFQRGGLLEFLVGLLQNGFVAVVQPVAFSFGDGTHGLGFVRRFVYF